MGDRFPPNVHNGPPFVEDIFHCLGSYKHTHDTVIKPWMYGTILSGVIYGTVAILYFAYIHLIRRQYQTFDQLTRQAWILLGYATLTFSLCTVFMGASLRKSVVLLNFPMCSRDDTQSAVLENVEGGAGLLGNICFMLTSWTADALLIWRCLIIYNDLCRKKWLVVAFPLILEVASISTGALFIFILSANRKDLFKRMIYYESITIGLNAILTILIIARLLLLRRRARRALGSNFGYEYTDLASMLTESQILTMVAQSVMLAFVCLSNSGYNNGPSLTMYQILGQVQALAPMLIIYRVIQGKAWSNSTFAQITKSHTMSFGTLGS